MTQDIDVVVDPKQTFASIDQFLESLDKSDFLFNTEAIRTAVDSAGMFQLLDKEESLKLDIYPREMIPGELDRSESCEIFEGVFLPIVSRLDAAASKLVWIGKGSHKSRRDLSSIMRNADESQANAVREMAQQLNLQELLDEVLAEADELQ